MKKTTLTAFTLLAALGLTVAAVAGSHEGEPSKGRHHGKMFEKMDADKDGAVTRAEAEAFHAKKFEKMDANADGKLTKEEVHAFHEKRREEREHHQSHE